MSTPGDTDAWVCAYRMTELGGDQPVHAGGGQFPAWLARPGEAVHVVPHEAVPLSAGAGMPG